MFYLLLILHETDVEPITASSCRYQLKIDELVFANSLRLREFPQKFIKFHKKQWKCFYVGFSCWRQVLMISKNSFVPRNLYTFEKNLISDFVLSNVKIYFLILILLQYVDCVIYFIARYFWKVANKLRK